MNLPDVVEGSPFEWNQQRNLLFRIQESSNTAQVCGTDLGELRRAWAVVLGRMVNSLPWFGCPDVCHPLVEWKGHGRGAGAWKSYHATRWTDQYLNTFHPRCMNVVGNDPGDFHPASSSLILHAWDPTHPAFLRKVIGRTSKATFKDSLWVISAYVYGFPHSKLMVDHPALLTPADPILHYDDPDILRAVVPEYQHILSSGVAL